MPGIKRFNGEGQGILRKSSRFNVAPVEFAINYELHSAGHHAVALSINAGRMMLLLLLKTCAVVMLRQNLEKKPLGTENTDTGDGLKGEEAVCGIREGGLQDEMGSSSRKMGTGSRRTCPAAAMKPISLTSR